MTIASTFRIYDGPLPLASAFPPTINRDTDPTLLDVGETPDCYGVAWDEDDVLTPGTIPTGTARSAPVGTGSYTSYNWYYNRLWKINAVTASILNVGAPEYRHEFYDQDTGDRNANADLITFMPMLQDSMLMCTATGSHMMQNCRDPRGFFWVGEFEQRFFAEAANRVTVLQGIPYACNADGLFRWDGKGVDEVSRPVRNNLAPFAAQAILADYDENLIIGTDAFVYDADKNKLFDYSTEGFRFTSRTLSQPASNKGGKQPFEISGIIFLFDQKVTDRQTIKWETRFDATDEQTGGSGDWYKEDDIILNGAPKRIELPMNNPLRSGREFSLRITSMSADVRIREIQVITRGYSQETALETA